MHKRRLVAMLFLKDGWMVRSQTFSLHQYIGDPVANVERMVQWDVDELIVLDIGASESVFDHHRADYRFKPVTTALEFIERAGVQCSIPLTFGGRIRTEHDVELRILNGADKVALNSSLFDDPQLIRKAAMSFGSQAIVASIDYRHSQDDMVYVARGRVSTGQNAVEWARRAEDLGAGEILLNAIERDGTAKGFDIEAIARVADAVRIPIIACGGAGRNEHFVDVFTQTAASAVAAGNIFHFKENAYPSAKAHLRAHLEDIR